MPRVLPPALVTMRPVVALGALSICALAAASTACGSTTSAAAGPGVSDASAGAGADATMVPSRGAGDDTESDGSASAESGTPMTGDDGSDGDDPGTPVDGSITDAGSRLDADADADAGPYRQCPAARTADDAGWLVTQGFDVSDYEYVDWDAATPDGSVYKYAFSRTTAGTAVDTQFARDWKEMKRVGLIRGAYHYFHAETHAAAQATAFDDEITAVGGLTSADFPPVLDMEDTAGMPTETVVCRMKLWLARVERATSRVPMVYSSQLFDALFDASFARYSLWTANFVHDPNVTCSRMLTAWPKWDLWQWSVTGDVPGVYENGAPNSTNGTIVMQGGKPVLAPTDVDFFNGTLADIQAFLPSTISTSPPPDPTPPSSPPIVAADAGTDCSDGCCVIEH